MKRTNHFNLIVMWEIPVPKELANWNRRLFVMDNQSLQEIIERISELKFNYIGSFPADFIPNLPKFCFAIINTASTKEVGEHWILIVRLNRSYYYADSLARSITHHKFLGKKVPKNRTSTTSEDAKFVWILRNFCGFSTI